MISHYPAKFLEMIQHNKFQQNQVKQFGENWLKSFFQIKKERERERERKRKKEEESEREKWAVIEKKENFSPIVGQFAWKSENV